jgi:hypothetical protein
MMRKNPLGLYRRGIAESVQSDRKPGTWQLETGKGTTSVVPNIPSPFLSFLTGLKDR